MFGEITPQLVAEIEPVGLPAEACLRIYRNHLVTTLSAALESTFPVVCRLVDKRFFAYAAHEYLRQHPPQSRCLAEYGAELADFLSGFEPCKDLPYLADVARFEWALNTAATVPEASPLEIEALAAIPPERASFAQDRSTALGQLFRFGMADRCDLAGEPAERSSPGGSRERRYHRRDAARGRGLQLATARPRNFCVPQGAGRRLGARHSGGNRGGGPRIRSCRCARSPLRRGACRRLRCLLTKAELI